MAERRRHAGRAGRVRPPPRPCWPAIRRRITGGELENIAFGQRRIESCLRRHMVTNYLPAQCCHNLGEYPADKPWTVDSYDAEELQRLSDHGIQLIQLFEEWGDPLRLFGGQNMASLFGLRMRHTARYDVRFSHRRAFPMKCLFLLAMLCYEAAGTPANLVKNPSFEDVGASGVPTHWSSRGFDKTGGTRASIRRSPTRAGGACAWASDPTVS